MKKNIGFIGCGKMASAIIQGCGDKYSISGAEINEELAKSAAVRLGIEVLTDNKKLAQKSDVIFIATKPNQVTDVLNEIREVVDGKLVISIAAGVTTAKIENVLNNGCMEEELAKIYCSTPLPSGEGAIVDKHCTSYNGGRGVNKNGTRVVRIMPNTPALVKLGMFGVCGGKYALPQDIDFAEEFLSNIGKCITVSENQMDIVTAISGSGPAFFYQVIEDMARAGEKLGLEYEKSLTLAAQTALGSAQMVFNRGETKVQTLIDNVATKGGCTFVGIEEMKNRNSREFFFDVIDKTAKKAHELG